MLPLWSPHLHRLEVTQPKSQFRDLGVPGLRFLSSFPLPENVDLLWNNREAAAVKPLCAGTGAEKPDLLTRARVGMDKSVENSVLR